MKENEANPYTIGKKHNIEFIKTEEEWEKYKTENNISSDEKKLNYMKYGTIYGKKYCVKTDYGSWDSDFTIEMLDNYISEFYKKLKKGGTIIIFFDLWKITLLKDLLEKHKFNQIRFIEWIKTNPQPLNSNVNYLTNCREIALVAVKGTKPTFNSKYDNGIYMYPLQGGKNRIHPTQKNLKLFEELILKHTNENDIVLDVFLGSGSTMVASHQLKRKCYGMELDPNYFMISTGINEEDLERLKNITEKPSHDYLVNIGIYLITKKIVNLIGKDKKIDFTDVIKKALDINLRIGVFPISDN